MTEGQSLGIAAGDPRFSSMTILSNQHSAESPAACISPSYRTFISCDPAAAVPLHPAAVYVLAKYDIAHYSRLKVVI
jgi:hypothetical protein